MSDRERPSDAAQTSATRRAGAHPRHPRHRASSRIDTRYEVHGYAGEFAAAMDAGGRLALVFEGDIFDDPGVGVNGEIFDADGRSLGTIPIRSDTGSGTEWYWAGNPAVAFADGVLLTAWVEQVNGVKAQFFRVR